MKDLITKDKHSEMTKGCPIFEWSPVIPITCKDNKTQNEEDDIASTHEDEDYDDITEMEKRKKYLKKRHTKMSTHQTGIMNQVTSSSETKTKLTNKTPPSKMTSQKE